MKNRILFEREVLDKIFECLYSKISFSELAFLLDVSPNTFKRWRSGTYSIPSEKFEILCDNFPELFKFKDSGKVLDEYELLSNSIKKHMSQMDKQEVNKGLEKARAARKVVSEYIKADLNEVDCCEAYGILIGDGHLHLGLYKQKKFTRVAVTCNAIKDYDYVTKYVTPLFNRIFQTNITSRISKKRGVIEYISGKRGVFDWFKNNKFPIGLKGPIRIPDDILTKSKMHINATIRGIFDTDGCTFARKDEDYKYPYINISSHSKPLRLQLKEILKSHGFPAYVHAHGVYVRGIENFKRWFTEIGSKNPRNLLKYEEFLNTGKIVPKNGPVM